MGIGASILLIAIGAILTFALGGDELFTLGDTSVNMDTVGVILMLLGVIGLVVTLLVFGPRRDRGTTVVERDREIL
jgi:hypothetical protein